MFLYLLVLNYLLSIDIISCFKLRDLDDLPSQNENSTNSISYKKAINPGHNILPSSINLYLEEDSSLALKNDNESIGFESQNDYVNDYFRKLNSSHVIAYKGEKLPIERKELAFTKESIEKGNENIIKMILSIDGSSIRFIDKPTDEQIEIAIRMQLVVIIQSVATQHLQECSALNTLIGYVGKINTCGIALEFNI